MARPEGADPLRVAAYRRGLFGEALAAWHYRLRLYRVLARRYKTPMGEIDLIVRRAGPSSSSRSSTGPARRRRWTRSARAPAGASPGPPSSGSPRTRPLPASTSVSTS
jgi:hypothetical protein